MSKKFKGKTCAYCSNRISTTGDHVFARQLFLKHRRDNLPKVPACSECNQHKSTLEHYVTAVIPFGGKHQDASKNLRGMVPQRLAKKQTSPCLSRSRETSNLDFSKRSPDSNFDGAIGMGTDRGVVYLHSKGLGLISLAGLNRYKLYDRCHPSHFTRRSLFSAVLRYAGGAAG